MVKASEIQVIWETERATVDRLLGDVGLPILFRLLEQTQQVAIDRRWPLTKITVQHYQDPEEDWEYLLLLMDFDCPRMQAKAFFWDDYIRTFVKNISKELEIYEQDILSRMIHFELESNP